MSKLYDCCCFLNENDLYEIRINQHWDYVDKFIVLESEETHTGDKKPLRFDKKRFEKYSDKLIYETIPSFDWLLKNYPDITKEITSLEHRRVSQGQSPKDFTRDHAQFDYLVKLAEKHGAKEEDFLIFSPLDEVISDIGFEKGLEIIHHPDPQTIDSANGWYKHSRLMGDFETKPFFYFSMKYYAKKANLYHSTQNCGGIFPFSTAIRTSLSTLRSLSICTHQPIQNGGWHFTSMDDGTGEMILQKYKSWAHSRDVAGRNWTYYDIDCPEKAKERLEKDWQVWNGCSKVEVNYENHPAYLVDNKEKFKHLLA